MTRDQTITARVWKALPTEARDALSGVAALRRVEKGEAIFAEGEPAEWETSIRTLSAMKRKGWLASGRGRVTILHPQSLRKLLDHRTPTPRADL